MSFNVFSLFNVTSLLSEYFKFLQFGSLSVGNSDDPSASAVEDGAETLDTDFYSSHRQQQQQQESSTQQFDFSILVNIWCAIKDTVQLWLESVGSPLEFTEFQLHICKTFLIILGVNLLLIGFYWRKYGRIITDRFIRPSTAKEIEELKLSVARLKLPKEHSPRI